MHIIKKKLITLAKKYSGGIPLDLYIQTCLFDKNGYYNKKLPIGKKADFITAPEISQLFGEILGLYIYGLWDKHLQCNFNLIELGPGKGTLIADILRITKTFKLFNNKMNLNLVEINQELINFQKKTIFQNNFDINKITWSNTFNPIQNIPSIIIANEFFDCFSIKQYININNRWHEKKINYNKEEDRFFIKNIFIDNIVLNKKLDEYAANNGYRGKQLIEISTSRDEYFNNICKFIKKKSGIAIIFDYGYFFPANYSTLQSIRYHRCTNILDNPGNQDISSQVNFGKFAKISNQNNLNFFGPFTQRDFLIKNGIKERKNKILTKANNEQKKSIYKDYIRLTSTKEMGALFKCIIVSSFNIYDKNL